MKIYVLVPNGNTDLARKVQEAGATPILGAAGDPIDGQPVVRGPANARPGVIVRGGLDRAGLQAAAQKGAAGVLLDAALWLLDDSPLTDADKAKLRALSSRDFTGGDVALPSGLTVGRDALLAPFVAKRARTLGEAIANVRADLAAAGPAVPPAAPAAPPPAAPAPVAPAPPPSPPPAAPRPAPSAPAGATHADVLAKVIELVAQKTGYPKDLLDPTLDMEADLGIDTVKQAEIFGTLRETFGIERDEKLTLKDIPTLGKVAEYLAGRMASGGQAQGQAQAQGAPPPPPTAPAAPARPQPAAPAHAPAPPPAPRVPAQAPGSFETRPPEEAVAIIGIGAVLPKANSAQQFWENVLNKVDCIVEVPRERWDAGVHYDADPSKEDKTYAKIGGFITGFQFDPLRFRIPPQTAKALDPVQQMALTAAAEALADAGYDRKPFDRARCAVILGNSLGGERKDETSSRMHVDAFAASLKGKFPPEQIEAAVASYKRTLPSITEDSMPGELSNVIAGRLANILNLAGKNMTTDAACASSHAALDTAVKAILGGEADMVLCGGADRSMDPATYVKFCKIGALSPDGSRPFDAGANGFVMGEGVAILLLKRLSDAVRDGDRIYCVIRGMGSSSDGKGKGITAPNPVGQKLAVERAFKVAEVAPKHVQLVEAHGTSTKVGDVVEVESVAELYKGVPAGTVALGSVKSQIGHLKSAAGAAGMLKAALALHHKTLPPSINFRTPNPNIKWSEVPFYVNTDAKPWPATPTGEPRRAAVSAFGFGGTNFHVILEEYVPAYHNVSRASHAAASAPRPAATAAPSVEGELVVLGADSIEGLVAEASAAATRVGQYATLETAAAAIRTPRHHTRSNRLALAALDTTSLAKSLADAAPLLPDPKGRAALPLKVKGALYGEGPKHAGKIAFLFPGQGSQYANMCHELAKRYPTVRRTFEEADAVLEPLIGRKLTSLIFVDAKDPAAVAKAEEALRQTEVTQPAMLAADVAIYRLLVEHGIKPDMVGGHSLGEYAALVAAGVLSFEDALIAVSARGKEMANVHVPDKGLMASISAGPDQVEAVLRNVPGYVVAANKNCPVQTVIAGETPAVQQAMQVAKAMGVDVLQLNVSAAFHTRIVAPASEPLRRVLERLTFRAPQVTCYTNVDATPYPADPAAQRDILSKQVAAPVEWIAELEAMYQAGARIFIEVGPKRALAGFVDQTLGKREGAVSVVTNHPKAGDLRSIYEALGKLATLGFELTFPAAPSAPQGVQERGQAQGQAQAQGAAHPTLTPDAMRDWTAFREAIMPSLEASMQRSFAAFRDELRKAQESSSAFEKYGLVPCDVVVGGASVGLPGQSRRLFDDSNFESLFRGENRIDRLDPKWADRFIEKEITRLVKDAGEPRMEKVRSAAEVLKLAGRRGDLDVVKEYGVDEKLSKTLDVTSKMAIAAALEALYDAGIPLVRETIVTKSGKTLPGGWVLPAHMQDETGVVFASAFPGYDNFVQEISRHLARKYARATLTELDSLYHELLDVVPAEKKPQVSRFYAKHAHSLHELAGDEDKLAGFNRHFLFAILSMGHAELAELIHARGPNTQINAACSSSTQAVAIAEDWLRTGRCRRVLVVGADDVTSENMLEWIGSGFLASGAATTAPSVEEGALPFDRRRHGMIIGSGAVGLVIERREDVEARGMVPIARVLATRVANSAYHGSRLHVDHIAGEARRLVETAAKRAGTTPEEMGPRTLFVSHETYTPARGGSASAEAAAMRYAFGTSATKVLVTNTKGFTGHAMGAGLEDALAVKALQFGRVPPIANLREIDPDFADLTLSQGGSHDRRYAMRFSAGFGSQLALALFEKMAEGAQRVADAGRYQAFLDRCAATSGAKAERVGRVLRIVNAERTAAMHTSALVRAPEPAPTPVPVVEHTSGPSPARPPAPSPSAARPAASKEEVLAKVIALVAEKTGYPREMLDPTLDMEADLGIDTVKQAEIFGQLRESFDIARDDKLTLKDIPTLGKVADYLAGRIALGQAQGQGQAQAQGPPATPGSAPGPAPTITPTPMPSAQMEKVNAPTEPARVSPAPPVPSAITAPQPEPGKGPGGADEVLAKVTQMIAAKTGYPPEMLDATLDMEADLGIDTVKQAEIFGEVRETFGIPKIEGINLKDYPTIRHVAGFVSTHAGRSAAAQDLASAAPVVNVAAVPPPAAGLVRRVPRVVDAPHEGTSARSAFVVGHGHLAEAARHHFRAATGDIAVFEGSARDLFLFAKSRVVDLEAGRLGLLVITHLGGTHGIDRAANPEHGGLTGAAKALAQEFPNAWVRALDLDPEEDIATRLRWIEAELRIDRSLVEVGRARGRRVVVETIEAGPTTAQTPRLREGSVILVTGGARGITAEVLRALAPQKPAVVMLGRTGAPTDDDATLDEAALRERAKADLTARGERVTPVALERWVAPYRARHEIWRTLRALEAAGAKASYRAVDVGDLAALERAVTDVRRASGRITGVIHAAGVEESKRLADKDEAAFDRAWRPKAEAALQLARLVEPDKPDFFVMFGSVAGRYGNAAQVDYSAANDCMAKLARALRQKGIPASVFAWGPWGEVGMATKGSTLTVLKAAGVEPITTSEGVGAFLSELARLDEPEVVLAKGLGGLARSAATKGAMLTLRADEPALNDHRVDGVPFMPGVMGLQAFADAAGGKIGGFEDVHWAYPVKLLRDQTVEATVKLEGDACALTTVPPGPLKQERTHFTARVLREAPAPSAARPSPAPSVPWVHDRIYPPFFHGPAFRVLSRATKVSWDSIEVEGREPAPGIPAMAATLEGALQALGLWGLAVARAMALPERVKRVALHGPFEPGATTYRVTGARLADGRVTGDVQCVAHGKVVADLEGVSLISTGEKAIDDAPAPWRVEDVDIAGARAVRVRVEDARALLARPELWSGYLGPNERAALSGLTVEKRREEWLAATLAGKTALRRARDVREWSAMEVLRGGDGAPVPHGGWGLTLSHAGGVAVALAFDTARERCGVDVETIEWRAPAFEDEAFSPEERREFPTGPGREQLVTTAWAAKEATLKALGVGLSIPLSSLRVKTNGAVQVEMSGPAKERFTAIDGDSLGVDARREGTLAYALARIRLARRG